MDQELIQDFLMLLAPAVLILILFLPAWVTMTFALHTVIQMLELKHITDLEMVMLDAAIAFVLDGVTTRQVQLANYRTDLLVHKQCSL